MGVGQFVALADGKDEQAFAPVRCADFRRRKQSCRKDVAHADQFSGDFGKSEAQMIGDIFEEDDRGVAFPDDAGNVRPEMARIGLPEAAAGDRERLARVARSEDIHEAAPWSAVEGCKVVPDRCRIQGFVFHPRHESGCGEGVARRNPQCDIRDRRCGGQGRGRLLRRRARCRQGVRRRSPDRTRGKI